MTAALALSLVGLSTGAASYAVAFRGRALVRRGRAAGDRALVIRGRRLAVAAMLGSCAALVLIAFSLTVLA